MITIDILKPHEDWPECAALIDQAIEAAYAHVKDEIPQDIEVSIVLMSDAQIQDLNKDHRGKDKPTNVLSFPLNEPDMIVESALGDIIFALETIQREAKDQDKSFEDHLMHLTIHGFLHLIGYDHETSEEDAEEMEALEIQILSDLNIKNPYETGQVVA